MRRAPVAARPVARRGWLSLALLFLAAGLVATPLAAKTLRFASAFDPQSMDPHALALLYQTRVVS
jgi:peptide/nickel transport system substrate-binding protein